MGFFSDTCMALVDQETGRALSGQALVEARQERRWPRCRSRVAKRARFCNKCGSPAPKGWWRCPQCKKWISNDSAFCGHCNARLYPEERADFAAGVWVRQEGVFSQRFEVGDVERMLQTGIQIQQGTLALVLSGGRFTEILDPGRCDPTSVWRTLCGKPLRHPVSVVLVDAGDVALPLYFDGLRSADAFELEFFGEVLLRFDREHAQFFLENRLKDARELSYEQMASALMGELRHVVDAHATKSQVKDLVSSPDERLRLQAQMDEQLKGFIERSGLELIRVSTGDFAGVEYERLVAMQGDVEVKRRELEYTRSMAQLLAADRKITFKDELDLKEYEALLAHEFGIGEEHRNRERELLLKGWRHEDQRTEMEHRITLTAREQEASLELEAKKHKAGLQRWIEEEEAKRKKRITDAQTDIEIAKGKLELENLEVTQAQEWRAKKNAQRQQDKQADAARRKGMSELELLTDTDDPDKRRDLLEFIRAKAQTGMQPEQILAMLSERSAAAADALIRIKQNDEQKYRELLEEVRSLHREAADRVDNNLKVTMEPVVAAATRVDTQHHHHHK